MPALKFNRKPLPDSQVCGYKNFETFTVIVQLDNDEKLYKESRALKVKDVAHIKKFVLRHIAPAFSWRKSEIEESNDMAGGLYSAAVEDLGPGKRVSAYLNYAISKIDWQEVAESLIEEE